MARTLPGTSDIGGTCAVGRCVARFAPLPGDAEATRISSPGQIDHGASPARYGRAVGQPWSETAAGVVRLPSALLVRGRGLLRPAPPGPAPEFAALLLSREPAPLPWPTVWVRWPDFGLPTDRPALRAALEQVRERAGSERVEVACRGGRGRTGTALACLAVLDGVPASEAVAFVRERFHPRAVETPWQRRFVQRFVA